MNIDDFIFINHNQLLKKKNMNIILNGFYNLESMKNKKIVHFCTFWLSESIMPNNNPILLNKYIVCHPEDKINDLIIISDNINDYKEKIISFFFNSGLKENIIFNNKLNSNDYEDNMIQNLFTIHYDNSFSKIYESSVINEMSIQLNSFNIFPYNYKINNLNIGIFLESKYLHKINFKNLIKKYFETKESSNLINIQKKNKKIYEKNFEPDIYFSKIFNQIYKNLQNEIIFEKSLSSFSL